MNEFKLPNISSVSSQKQSNLIVLSSSSAQKSFASVGPILSSSYTSTQRASSSKSQNSLINPPSLSSMKKVSSSSNQNSISQQSHININKPSLNEDKKNSIPILENMKKSSNNLLNNDNKGNPFSSLWKAREELKSFDENRIYRYLLLILLIIIFIGFIVYYCYRKYKSYTYEYDENQYDESKVVYIR